MNGPDLPAGLKNLEAGEADNLAKSKIILGNLWTISEPVVLLYSGLSQCLFKRDDARDHGELYGIAGFLLSAQRAASLGVLSIGRLHIQETAQFTRRCLELVGFSHHAWQEPKALELWLHAGGSEATYEAYQQKFSSRRLNEDLRQLDATLPTAYERCNKMIHSSLYSIAHSYEQAKIPRGEELRIHMFDVQTNDQWPRVALELLVVLDTHLKSTAALADKLLKGPRGREARKSWKQLHDPALGDFRKERDGWRGRLEAYRRTRPRERGMLT